jgi:hypothetical protein
MKVFICWSGERSQAVALSLRDWMPLVLHFVQPWLSDVDIAAGERWTQSVAKELETTNLGIICLTRENVGSPWILFEAGSLAKSFQGSKVIPLLLDLEFSEITGPLAQFQAKKVDKDGINEMMQSINQAEPQPIPETTTKELFEALWPKLEKQLGSVPKKATTPKTTRPQHEILEELVAGVRSLESHLRDVEGMVSEKASVSRRLRRRFHPMMFEEMMDISGEAGDPIGILLAASMVREDMPWFYEIALEAYHAVKAGDTESAEKMVQCLNRLNKFMMHGPFMEEFGSKETHMFMMEFPSILDHMLRRCIETKKPPTRRRGSGPPKTLLSK